jgi:hypothetical protein
MPLFPLTPFVTQGLNITHHGFTIHAIFHNITPVNRDGLLHFILRQNYVINLTHNNMFKNLHFWVQSFLYAQLSHSYRLNGKANAINVATSLRNLSHEIMCYIMYGEMERHTWR